MSQQINLFNPALLKQKEVFTARTMAGALALLLVGGVLLAGYTRYALAQLEAEARSTSTRLEKAKSRQNTAQSEFAPRQKSQALEAQITQTQLKLRSLHEIEVILQKGGLGNTGGFADYFKALARQSRGELWLTGVTIEDGGTQLGLQGRALEANYVPAYITRLTREPVMQGKSFGSLQIREPAPVAPGAAGMPAGAGAPTGGAPATPAYVEFSLQAAGAKPESPVAGLGNAGLSGLMGGQAGEGR
jgi:hypothetical protein